METIEEAIASLMNGNLSAVRKWRTDRGITVASMLAIYLMDYDPNKIEILSFVRKLEID